MRLRMLAVLLLSLCSFSAAAAAKAELWERWTRSDEKSTTVVDHGAWDRFLEKYLVASKDGIARLRYAAVTGDDAGLLRLYLDDLQRTPVSKLRRDEQRAYWINLYNACTIKLVLDRFPLKSILDIDISPGLFAKGPWGARQIKVEDQTLSLDDIEHRILRPIWKDPRTHYSVNCASLGCPNLAAHAFTAANTEILLDAGARAFVNHPRGVRVEDGRLYVSSIYAWFADDFGGKDARVIEHLGRYAETRLAAQLAAIEKISGDDYDWAVNETP
ncbi:MAG: DUF547 domain-containing protein [Panacagrimonas sp.]